MKTFLTACLLLLATSAFAQPRPGAFTTLFTTGFGTPIVASAGGTGSQIVAIRNTSAGVTNLAQVSLGTDLSAQTMFLRAMSSTWSPVTYNLADSAVVGSLGAGGLNLAADNTTGPIRFYTGGGGTVERARIFPSGGVSIGNTTDPGATNLYVTGSVRIGTILFANLTNVPDGTLYWCSDCTPGGATCTGGGNGALAMRFNNLSWRCV